MPLRATWSPTPIATDLTANAFGIDVLPPIFLKRELASGRLDRLTCNPSLPMHHIAVAWRSEAGRRDLRPIAEIAQDLIPRAPRERPDPGSPIGPRLNHNCANSQRCLWRRLSAGIARKPMPRLSYAQLVKLHGAAPERAPRTSSAPQLGGRHPID